MAKVISQGCEHCGGDLVDETDEYKKTTLKCFQCGRTSKFIREHFAEADGGDNGAYWDKHRDEILADRLAFGHARTLVKWKIPLNQWQDAKMRWIKQGIEVTDLRKRDNAQFRNVEDPTPRPEPQPPTPTVREEHKKSVEGTREEKTVLGSEDKIEITVGRLEELLREIEYLKGYRQAILDVFGNKREKPS